MAAARSSKIHKIPIHEDELCCPVCFDELVEPKALPGCAHRICKKCLENIARTVQDQHIECPLCRKRSSLPEGGVEYFPTDHLVKQLVENIPGRKEKLALEQAVKDCEEKLEVEKATLGSMEELIVDAENEEISRVEDVKRQISEHAHKLKEFINEKKDQLCSKLDDYLIARSFKVSALQRTKQILLDQIKQTELCTSNVLELLGRDCLEDIKELKDVMVLQLKEQSNELQEPNTTLESLESEDPVKFHKNYTIFVVNNILGSVNKLIVNKVEEADVVRCMASLTVDLDLQFEPLSLAISTAMGEVFFGIVRSYDKQFDVFDIKHNHLKSVSLDAALTSRLEYGDICFSMKEDTLLVMDRIGKRLLNYSLDGRRINSKIMPEYNIAFISLDENDRVILTTTRREINDPKSRLFTQACCVIVFDRSNNKIQLKFGESNLHNPSGRAVYHEQFFFVPDSYSYLKLFNERGQFVRNILLNGINSLDHNIFCVDIYKGSIIASNSQKKIVKVFSILDCSLISTFPILNVPLMIDALPINIHGRSRMAVIYVESTRLDVIEY